MAWTTPRTYVTGELVTASILNTDHRDNLAYLKNAPTFDGVIVVAGFGSHEFTANGTGVNRVRVVNGTSGTGNFASFRATAGTSDFFINTFSQGYSSTGADFASGTSLEVTTAGGFSINASMAGATVRIYGANTLAATFASTGVTIPGTLGLTGNLAIATNKFVVVAASGNTQAAGTLECTGNFLVNTNKFTVNATNGNTAVAGSFGVTGQALFSAGTAGAPGIAIGGSTSGIAVNTETLSELDFVSAGVTVAYLSDTGNPLLVLKGRSNATGSGTGIELGRNSNGSTPSAGSLGMFNQSGTRYWIYPDSSGDLRIKSGAQPLNSTEGTGTVVGTQTSTRASKVITGRFADNRRALRTILTTPLYRFRYRNGAYNRQGFVGIVTDDSPAFGMDRGRSFNPVTAFGYTVAAFKAQQTRIDNLEARLARLERRRAA